MAATKVLVPHSTASKAGIITVNEVFDNLLELPVPKTPSEKSLLEQLTLQEKVALLSGSDFASATGVERLKIPALKTTDTVNGVKGSEYAGAPSTLCFPSTVCLGATWNPSLLERMGKAVAEQAKSKSVQVVLGPAVNMHRDPRAGRNFECFSEDPLITGRLAAALVNGIQKEGVAACPKHFVANDSETKRRLYNVAESLDGRSMREIYLAAFQVLLRESDPMSLMTAYNKVDGTYCSENSKLIKGILREEWSYQGLVMSDWFGTRSGKPAIVAGLDLEMPGPTIFRGAKLTEDVENGLVNVKDVDERVSNVLRLVERTKASHSTKPEQSLYDENSNRLAKEIATEGIVLVQNRKAVLPLRKSARVAVVGAAAINPPMNGGGSASAPPQYVQKPLDCIRSIVKAESIEYAAGVKIHATVPVVPQEQIFARNGEHGIDVRYLNDGVETSILEEYQESPHVIMLGRTKPGLNPAGFSYEISTTLVPHTTGTHTIGIQATGSFVLQVNGKQILSKTMTRVTVEDFLFEPVKLERTVQIPLKANTPYFLKLTVQPHKPVGAVGEPHVHAAKLCFIESYSDAEAIAEAVRIAQDAEVSVIFAGRSGEYESEGYDMKDLVLPLNQVAMIKAVAAASRRSVVVLNSGNPIDVRSFVDDVDAIVVAHFLGQEGGAAIAEILCGEVCPSGKLAVTWPRSLKDTPTCKSFPATETGSGWEISYPEGVAMGYRHNGTVPPQWAFGHGLSYTTFETSELSVEHTKEDLNVTLKLANTGAMAGAEVVQVYIQDVVASVSRPSKELKAFKKIHLQPGEVHIVKLSLKKTHAFSFWDEKECCWKAEKGEFRICINDLVASVYLDEDLTWSGL